MPSHSTHINYYTRPACMGLGTLKITNFPIINPHGPTSPEKLCFWWCCDPLEQGVYGGACGCYVTALT